MSEITPTNLTRLKEQLEMIRITEKKIDLANDPEQDIMASLKIINKASYTAMCVVEQDIQER